MSIYSRRGDGGNTQLFGGEEVWKDAPRLEALGCLDELNAWIGVLLVYLPWDDVREWLDQVQNDLHTIASELASPLGEGRGAVELPAGRVEVLEQWIDRMSAQLPALHHLIRLRGSEFAAWAHVARTVCRRAERRMAPLLRQGEIREEPFRYMNRLSDFLFMLARLVNARCGTPEQAWKLSAGPEKA
jgi:cob(I)alamin adenosyltransferase